MSQSIRVKRYEKEIRQLSADFLGWGVKDPVDGVVTVSRAEVTSDLRSAKVFIHYLGDEDPEQVIKLLQSYSHSLQKYIHTKLRSKFCAKILFVIDKNYDKVLRVEQLLHEISEKK